MSKSRKRDRAVISTALNVGMKFGEQKSADSIEELQSRIEQLEAAKQSAKLYINDLQTGIVDIKRKYEALEAENERLRDERLAFATESEQRQSRIETLIAEINTRVEMNHNQYVRLGEYQSRIEELEGQNNGR